MEKTLKIFLFIFMPQGIWCNDWNIIVPDKIEALEGSCVSINCRFDIPDRFDLSLTNPAVGVWYKTVNTISTLVFSSSRPTLSLLKGNITGKLIYRDCTTIFFNPTLNDRGIYNFRIECNALKYTFTQKTVSIAVIQSPPNPTLRMFTGQMEVQEVLEGNAVNLRCSAITLCSSSPPTLTWRSSERLPLNNRLPQQQNQTEIFSDLNFTASHLQHGVTFICYITYQLQNRNATAQSNITLRVLYAPKNTSVSVFPSNSVLEGTSVTLTCRSDANPAVLNYTWLRENGGRVEQLQSGQNQTFNVTDRTHTGRYYCRTTNQLGTGYTVQPVLLDIQYTPKNTSITAVPSSTVLEGNPVTLICNADANPALVNYTWYRENRGQFQRLQNGYNLTFSITNSTQSGNYYCIAENKHGQQNTSVLLDVQFAPKNTSASLIPSSTVIEGLPVTLICNTNANPALVNYTWYRENRGQFQQLQTGYNLTYSITNSTQSGNYYCIAQNKHGQQNSSVLLDVQYPPKYTSISAIPSSTVLEGNPVTLICSSDANPALINQTWYKEIEGQLEQLQTGDNLTLRETNTTHTGWYYCVAQNKHGQQNSSFFLDIQYPPKNTLTSVIPSRTILEGNPATLTCNTDANPPLVNYTWYREISGQFQQLQTENNLTFSITNSTQSGNYYCIAQNKHGQQNSSVLLDVQYPPKYTSISAIPSSTVLEGNPVTLICSSDANPALINQTWYKEIEGQLEQLQTGDNLTLRETNTTHTGWYYCVAKNKHGQQNSSFFLDIQYPPKNTLTSVIPSRTILEGNPATLTCNTDANPPLVNYTWYREISGQFQQLQTENNLTFSITNHTHFGWYYCVAQNKHGKQNTSVLLDIQFSPKDTTIFSSTTVLEGNPVSLICSANGNPALLNYTWYREIRGQLQQFQTGYNLTLSVTNRGHSGLYHCVAQNKHGQQNTSVMLDIQYASEVASSKCDKTQQTVCLCEVNGNPSSKVEWFLSGRPITNSTNIFIREERLSQTNLKSYVTLLQSPTLNDILQCVSTNTRGTASTKFQLVASPQETTGVSGSSVMIGIVIGVLLIMAFLVIKHLCNRNKTKGNSSITSVEDVTGFNLTNRAAPQENVPSVYATGATTLNYSQSPYYFSNDFTNGRPE